MQLHPYLFFEGRCEEAAQFYERAVGAKIGRLLRLQIAQIRASAAPRNPIRSCT
jgi:PhnB protein